MFKRFIMANVYSVNDEKKMNFQTHNNLQPSHVIAIFAVFRKLLQKRSYKMKHYVISARNRKSRGILILN